MELRERAVGVARVRGSRQHVEAVQREHTRDLAEDPRPVVGHDGQHPVAPLDDVTGLRQTGELLCARELDHVDAFGLATFEHVGHAVDEERDELGLGRAPRGRTGRKRVGFRERGEQLKGLDRSDPLGGPSRRLGIVEVAPNRDLGQQQVVLDELGEHIDIRGRKAEARAETARELDTDLDVIAGVALAEIVQQRTQHEQVGAVDALRERRRIGNGLEQVPVDGEPVVRVALRPRTHRRPLRKDAHPQTAVIECFDDGNRVLPGEQERDEQRPRLARPRIREARRVGDKSLE